MENTQEQKENNIKVFKEVAESNFDSFKNKFISDLQKFSVLKSHKIGSLTDDEARQLGINFVARQLSKEVFENQDFYFDKKLISKIYPS